MSAAASNWATPPAGPAVSPRRRGGWGALWRRKGMALVAASLAATLVFLLGFLLPRTYRVAASVDRVDDNPALLPNEELRTQDPAALQRELARLLPLPAENRVETAISRLGPLQERLTVRLESPHASSAADYANAMLNRYVEQARRQVQTQRTQALIDLHSRAESAIAAERAAQQAMEAFRVAHAAEMPDDPNGVLTQLNRLTSQIEDRDRDRRVAEDRLARLADRRTKLKNHTPLAPASAPADTPPAPLSDDPEVMQLQAQLGLLNDQIEEQTTTLHRTDQHPEVVKLRSRLNDVQQKLAAAKARAARGAPPPPTVKVVPNTADAAAVQMVELQIEQVQAEKEQITVDLAKLQAQRDKLQKQASAIVPIRQQWNELAKAHDAAAAASQAAGEQLQRFKDIYEVEPRRGLRWTNLQPATPPSLPVTPRFRDIALLAAALGVVIGMAAAVAAERLDPRFADSAEFAAVTGLPVLGAIGPIAGTAAERRWRALRLGVLLPLGAVALLAVPTLAGLVCRASLRDADFSEKWQRHGWAVVWQALQP